MKSILQHVIAVLLLSLCFGKDVTGTEYRDVHGNVHVNKLYKALSVAHIDYTVFDSITSFSGIVNPGQLSKDGLHYIFSITNGSRSRIYVLNRPDTESAFSHLELIQGRINDTLIMQKNIQPTLSADGNTIVFVRNSTSSWGDNDLYIAVRQTFEMRFDSLRALTEINAPDKADAYPWLSPDGLRLYYTRADVDDRIYFTERSSTDQLFQSPLPVSIPYEGDIRSAWLTDDEKTILFTSSGAILKSTLIAPQTFDTPTVVVAEDAVASFVSGPSYCNNELYFFKSNLSDSIVVLPCTLDISTAIAQSFSFHSPIDDNHVGSINPAHFVNLLGQKAMLRRRSPVFLLQKGKNHSSAIYNPAIRNVK
jgi:hypothetical protein